MAATPKGQCSSHGCGPHGSRLIRIGSHLADRCLHEALGTEAGGDALLQVIHRDTPDSGYCPGSNRVGARICQPWSECLLRKAHRRGCRPPLHGPCCRKSVASAQAVIREHIVGSSQRNRDALTRPGHTIQAIPVSREDREGAKQTLWVRSLSLQSVWRLQATDPACNQKEPKTDNPGPGCDRFANMGKAEVRGNCHEEEHETDDPDNHRWSFTGIAH